MMQDDVANIFANIPNNPLVLNPIKAAVYKLFPKLMIGVVAPAPTTLIILSYIPKNPNSAPNAANDDVKCPGVSFV